MRFFLFNLELFCTCGFFKKLKLHLPKQFMHFSVLQNSLVQINCILNLKPHDYLYLLNNTRSSSLLLFIGQELTKQTKLSPE